VLLKGRVKELRLDYETIDCFPKGYMIYYKVDATLSACKFCGSGRYKSMRNPNGRNRPVPCAKMHYLPLIPRLQ